jgi:hypothetical protein
MANGLTCKPLVEFSMGPFVVKEFEVVGPEHLLLALIETNAMRPCVFDKDPKRLHSEVHSVVWAVASVDEALPPWCNGAQLKTLIDTHFGGPIISKLMELPKPEVPVRFSVMADEPEKPIRLEFIEFTEETGKDVPQWPLAAGLFAAGYSVPDLERAQPTVAKVTGKPCPEIVCVDSPIHPQARVVTAVAPGGVRFEVWQERI